jgi:predicted Fe-Mo cluster-binding NifX family protein
MVKIAIPSNENGGLSDTINFRFGRCSTFTIITLEKDEIKAVEVVKNYGADSMGGAGIQSAQTLANNGAQEVIVGNLGPNAVQSLNALKLKIYQAPNPSLKIKDLIDMRIRGELNPIENASVSAHFGMGSRQGGRFGGGRFGQGTRTG